MKVFLIWADKKAEMRILFDAFARGGHEVLYWVGERGGEHHAPKNTVFHDHYDAWAGLPAEFFANERFDPASSVFIEKHYELESLVLTMMNKRYDRASVDERKQIYYNMLSYWSSVLEKLQPEAIVFTTIPHSIYDFILYTLAREKNLKMLMFEDTWVAGRLVWINDYQKGSSAFAEAVARNKKRSISWDDIGGDLRAYYETQAGSSPVKPAYMQAQQHAGQTWRLFWHRVAVALRALTEGNLHSLLWDFARRILSENLKSEYMRFVRSPEWSVPFVYFPLGFQPERTTSPQGEIFHDQILAIQTLAAALPPNWEIYIKEHPSQWWLRGKTRFSSARYRGYYERLAAIPHVRLVPIHTDSHTLIARSQTVATITGTAGWESLFRRKRPLIFGYPWYVSAPQIFRVASVDDCRKALSEIQRKPLASEKDLLVVLKSLEEGSMRAYIGIVRDQFSELPYDVPISAEASMQAVGERIQAELATL
ncbi:hypothetical protein A3A39_02435 [Candidatus Kaiserbacteria bacterium RIFCSPLOWO2_01_FULL_54_13]|uniref:Capsular biosynthesis protein n=1 Tax=Candidatus Kaiserbacteria bacterium RIFCSPLOWO2_01_FULL_54_13 TaxID=1798512 RepID=A0A1F6F147_9BACT|nr:MAG: hypothetical protein A3A39_02435 [Candidatus Kaiserbacteria bacterium RIFCSPLOWO2_01_FULL_54_13]